MYNNKNPTEVIYLIYRSYLSALPPFPEYMV